MTMKDQITQAMARVRKIPFQGPENQIRNFVHTDKEGKFHRVELYFDPDRTDSYVVKCDRKDVWWGDDRFEDQANSEFDRVVAEISAT